MTVAREPIAPVHLVTAEGDGPQAVPAGSAGLAATTAGVAAGLAFAAAAAWFVRWSRERVLPAHERAMRRMSRGLRLRPGERRIVRDVAAAHAEAPPSVAVLVSREAFEAGAAVARAGGRATEVELGRIRRKVFGAA